MPKRVIVGFIAGFVSVWVFSSGAIAVVQAVGGAVPFAPWSMAPVPPFGVPQTLSAAFFGGLWGILYAVIEPRLTANLGWVPGGLVYGLVPMLALWFIVFPLKGIPVGAGFSAYGVFLGVLLHLAFGLGLAIFYRLVRSLTGGRTTAAPTAP